MFQDHFSGHANAYARHRPRYPEELFAWLASESRAHRLAWDAGAGSGQVAGALVPHFERVVGTDASDDQLRHAEAHERVEYRTEPSDQSSLDDVSVDLITAGSAAHWFELDGFYREVNRVAKRGAVICLFSYGPRDFTTGDSIDGVVERFQEDVLAGYWPERIQYVHDRYATLPFAFEEIASPAFEVRTDWTMLELLAFLETWSASGRYFQERGTRATDAIRGELAHSWGDPARARRFRCPLFMRVGRV